MTPTPNTPPPGKFNPAATKKLFTLLGSFLKPIADCAGLTLRPFSITTFTSMQMAGIAVGSADWKGIDDKQQVEQLSALLVIQTAPLEELAPALRAANGDFDEFFWKYAFFKGAEIPLEGIMALNEQLDGELPAVEAAMVETQVPPGQSSPEKAPGN